VFEHRRECLQRIPRGIHRNLEVNEGKEDRTPMGRALLELLLYQREHLQDEKGQGRTKGMAMGIFNRKWS